jgi:hypothetical protein
MRKVLFLILCVLLLGVVAAPALATEPVPPPDTAVLWWPFDGSWYDFPAGVPEGVLHDAGTPIPNGDDVWIGSGWVAETRGLVRTVPIYLQYKVDVPGVLTTKWADSRSHWWAPFVTDGQIPAFNPRIGAKTWAIYVFFPLGKLGPGDYTGAVSERCTHTTTDLGILRENGHGPTMFKPWLTDYPEMSFSVSQ